MALKVNFLSFIIPFLFTLLLQHPLFYINLKRTILMFLTLNNSFVASNGQIRRRERWIITCGYQLALSGAVVRYDKVSSAWSSQATSLKSPLPPLLKSWLAREWLHPQSSPCSEQKIPGMLAMDWIGRWHQSLNRLISPFSYTWHRQQLATFTAWLTKMACTLRRASMCSISPPLSAAWRNSRTRFDLFSPTR